MPIFISYSHHDKDFVDTLACKLAEHNINIQINRCELSIGDSILGKIKDTIEGSSAFLVILSKKSIESGWCKKEISVGLLKELEENKVMIIPVLIEDCDLPIFVRGKLYADFRPGFDLDVGLHTILEEVREIAK
jgi:hypothetical protein